MKSKLRLASIVLFALLGLFLLWFGIVYATVHDMLWFHAAAIPASIHQQVLPLYFALMKLIGGSSIALALLAGYMIAGPLRRGVPGAGTALAITLAIPFLTAAFVAEQLAATTGAPTSWHIMGVLLAVTAAAYGAYVGAHRLERRHAMSDAPHAISDERATMRAR